MPSYHFKCVGCGQELDVFTKASALDDFMSGIECACDKPLFSQIVGTPAIKTCGDGFYKQGFTGN